MAFQEFSRGLTCQRLGMPCSKEQHSPAVYSSPKTCVAFDHPSEEYQGGGPQASKTGCCCS